jgi:tRNA threonylcarbamoyladenosine biosynthesis protein TsaE
VKSEKLKTGNYVCKTQNKTFKLGEKIGKSLHGGEILLLEGGLGAGKTLLTKGILSALDYDADEVTSPSFSLVNRYDAKFTVFHLDLWRIEKNAAFAVGLDEMLDEKNCIIIIEWAERLENLDFEREIYKIKIEGDGVDARKIEITKLNADERK